MGIQEVTLGAIWQKNETVFKVFAPEAKEVIVNLYESGDSGEAFKSCAMERAGDIFYLRLAGDFALEALSKFLHRTQTVVHRLKAFVVLLLIGLLIQRIGLKPKVASIDFVGFVRAYGFGVADPDGNTDAHKQ